MGLQRAGEGFRTRQQPLLQVDERQPSRAPRRRTQLGVASQLLGKQKLRWRPVPELAARRRSLLPGLGIVRRLFHAPCLPIVAKRELHQQALGELLHAELTQVALEPSHHDRLEVLASLHGHPARESYRVEDLEQCAEAVRVPVVRRGAQKQTVVEARREVTDRARDVRVGCVLAGRRWRRDVCFIQDEQPLARTLSQVREERVPVLGTAKQRVGHDEPIVRAPCIRTEPSLPSTPRHELPRHYLEPQAEPALHLVAPLQAHGRGAHHEHEARLLPQQKLLQHEPCLDGLSEPDVVRDEQVRTWQLERLHERGELVGHELDARSKRGLEAVGVRRAHRAPLECVQVRPEVRRWIEARPIAQPVRLRLHHPRPEFEVPEHVEGTTRVVVVQADEPDHGGLARLSQLHALDEPLTMPRDHDLPGQGQVIGARGSGAHRRRFWVSPGGFEQRRLQIHARSGLVGEPVPTTRRAELVASQLLEQGGHSAPELPGELEDQPFLGSGRVAHFSAEEAEQVEQAGLREGVEEGLEGGSLGRGFAHRFLGGQARRGARLNRSRIWRFLDMIPQDRRVRPTGVANQPRRSGDRSCRGSKLPAYAVGSPYTPRRAPDTLRQPPDTPGGLARHTPAGSRHTPAARPTHTVTGAESAFTIELDMSFTQWKGVFLFRPRTEGN